MDSSSAKYFFLFSTAILFALIGSRSFGGMDVDELSFSEKWINQKATVESECKEHSITLTKSISSAILKVEKSSSVEIAQRLDEFDYIIQYSCISLTDHCDNVVIRDTLPDGLAFIAASSSTPGTSIDVLSNKITATFTQGNGTGLAAGSTGQLVIRTIVRANSDFEDKINTAFVESSNAGMTEASDTMTVISDDVIIDYTYNERFEVNKNLSSDIIPGGFGDYGITPFNVGLNDIANIDIIDTLPQEFILHNITTTEQPGTSTDFTISVKLETDLNTWIPIIFGNTSVGESHNLSLIHI